MRVSVTWGHISPHKETIWEALARKLGREPTHAEAKAEVSRILTGVTLERAVTVN
jgi:hypothetical protein